MTYQVPQHIDKNKIFVVQRSEIEGRLDPKMALYNRRVQNSIYPKVRLKDLLVCKPQYGANESGVARLSMADTRYIRITDIDEYGLISNKDLGATVKNIEEKYILNENDILIARSGATVGKAYIHKKMPYDCIFAGYLIRFVLNCAKVLPDYVFIWTQLNAYKEWVNAIQRPSGQPNINAEEYKSLEIPLPNIEKQKEIVAIVHSAYTQKLQKESEAQQLLDSIIDKVLAELGISLPHIEKTLSKRIFTTSFRQIQSNRFDPKGVLFLGDKSGSSIFENVSLKSIAKICKGNSLTSKEADITGLFPVIAGGQISPYNHNVANYNGNVITVSASGAYAGYVWYHDYPIYATDCCVIQSRNEQKYLTSYLYEVLHAQQERIYMYQQGAGQPHVYASDLEKILIPKISIEQQRVIVTHAKELRTKAKALQAEGKAILENAKKEVEKMIMGE